MLNTLSGGPSADGTLAHPNPFAAPTDTLAPARPFAAPTDTPMQNGLLAALPGECYTRLLPYLEAVSLPRDWTIYGACENEKYAYFVTSGIVSQGYVMEDGATAGFALTGSEGVVGIAPVLGGNSLPHQAVVLIAGRAFRIGAGHLLAEFDRPGPLKYVLLRYVLSLIAQIGQVAACNRHHTIEQQFCRHLLASLDRARSNDLATTQARIADVLGVRRESVSDAAAKLHAAGLIVCGRGHITVPDRHLLAARACECYEVTASAFGSLLPQYRVAQAA